MKNYCSTPLITNIVDDETLLFYREKKDAYFDENNDILCYKPLSEEDRLDYDYEIEKYKNPIIIFRDKVETTIKNIDIQKTQKSDIICNKYAQNNEEKEKREIQYIIEQIEKMDFEEKNVIQRKSNTYSIEEQDKRDLEQIIWYLKYEKRDFEKEKGRIYFPPTIEVNSKGHYPQLPDYRIKVLFEYYDVEISSCYLEILFYTSINPYSTDLIKKFQNIAQHINFFDNCERFDINEWLEEQEDIKARRLAFEISCF